MKRTQHDAMTIWDHIIRMCSLMFWKVRYKNVNSRGNAASRKREQGEVKPRVRMVVVSWRAMVMAGCMGAGKGDIVGVEVECEAILRASWDKAEDVLLDVESDVSTCRAIGLYNAAKTEHFGNRD